LVAGTGVGVGFGLVEVDAGLGEAVVFELDVVVVVDVVEAHDGVSFCQKGIGQMESDESGGTGYKYFCHV